MKKSAIIIIATLGTVLLTLNYVSSSEIYKNDMKISFFGIKGIVQENNISEDTVETNEIKLPSIFTVIFGLLK
ncbi:MAG: hypothetical protein ACPGRC_06920 [Salibacteraceae bacterium]